MGKLRLKHKDLMLNQLMVYVNLPGMQMTTICEKAAFVNFFLFSYSV